MADSVKITIEADDKTAAGIASVVSNLGKIEKAATSATGKATGAGGTGASGLSSAFGALGKQVMGLVNPYTLASVAIWKGVDFMRDNVKAAEESAKVDAKLEAVLKSTGYAAGVTSKAIDEMSTAKMKSTGIDDELIKNNAAVLATFTQVGNKVFPDATQAAIDMSTVLGTDLQSAIIQVGKALNVTAGDTTMASMGMTALRRSGVSFTEEQKKMALQMVETGDIIGYQKLVLAELNREFGGAANAMFEAGTKAEGTANAWENLKEIIGNEFLPVSRSINESLTGTIEKQQENIEANNRQADSIEWVKQNYDLLGQTQNMQIGRGGALSEAAQRQIDEYQRLIQYGEAWEKQVGNQSDAVTEVTQDYSLMLKAGLQLTKQQETYNDTAKKIEKQFDDNAAVAELYKGKLAEIKDQYKDGEMTAYDYYDTVNKIREEYKSGAFAAQQQAGAMRELEAAQDSQGQNMLSSLLAQKGASEELQYQFAGVSGQITKSAASQGMAISKIADALMAGKVNAEQAARAVKAVTGDLSALDGMSVETYIDLFITTHGTMTGASDMTQNIGGGGSTRRAMASGGTLSPGQIAEVGEIGREGLRVNRDGSVTVIPSGAWSQMKKWGVMPDAGFADGLTGISAGSSITRDSGALRALRSPSVTSTGAASDAPATLSQVREMMQQSTSDVPGSNAVTDLSASTIRRLSKAIGGELSKVVG